MALIVQKYGGTSVGSIARIREVAKRIKRFDEHGHQLVVVVSAMSGETNRLLALTQEIYPHTNTWKQLREIDQVIATGEQVSIGLLCLALQALGIDAISLTGMQAGIQTDPSYTKSRILNIESQRMQHYLDQGKVLVVAGFQGETHHRDLTTLGRGGSDTTGVAIASALQADECQIYTDVDGVYSADPRIVPEATRLPIITFEEMLEMASLGSKVLQTRAVELAGKNRVKLRVLSSFTEHDDDDEGTLITFEEQHMEQPTISGIAHQRDEAKITLLAVPDQPGVAYQILKVVADQNIEVDMIIQNASIEGYTDFSFTVSRHDCDRVLAQLEALKEKLGAKALVSDTKIAKVSVVGIGMRSHVGIASKMFEAMAKEQINIKMISTSEIKVSMAIDEKYMELAVRSLHQAFELDCPPQ